MVYANVRHYPNGLCMCRIFPQTQEENEWVFNAVAEKKPYVIVKHVKTEIEYYGILPSSVIKEDSEELEWK